MKKIKSLLFIGLIVPCLVGCGGKQTPTPGGGTDEPGTLSGETIDHSFVNESQLVNARFPYNDANTIGNEEEAFGVKWYDDTWTSFKDNLNDNDSTYARIKVAAPWTGTYPIKLKAKHFNQSFPMRLFVNNKTSSFDLSISDANYSWANDERETSTNITLNKGNNILVVQLLRWGGATKFTLPKEVSVVKDKTSTSGEYDTNDFIYQATKADTDPFLPTFSYLPHTYDSNHEFESASILHFVPSSSTKSLDVTYQINKKDNGSAGIEIKVGNNPNNKYQFDASSDKVDTSNTYHIPSYVLSDLGFAANGKQNIRFSPSSGNVTILKIKESSATDISDNKTLGVAELKKSVLVRGRNIESNNSIGLDYTAAGFEFEITGGGDVYANLQEVNDAFGNKNTSAGGTRFAIEIDGVFKEYVRPTSNTKLATGLSAAKHKIALYKTSEAAGGLVDLISLKVNSNSQINKPTKDYKFEILGDSITCGNQISATDENGYLAYATQLSKSYNADYNVISVSGRGLKVGYNSEEGWAAKWDNQIKDLWTMKSYFRDKGVAKWDHSSYIPDVVIVNLGNNDLGDWIMQNAPMTITQFTDEVKSFSGKLRSAYPNAKIIWCYGAFVNRKYESEYRSAVESLNDENIQFVYFDQMGGGADGHPNANQHQTIADILSTKISQMLGINNPRAN